MTKAQLRCDVAKSCSALRESMPIRYEMLASLDTKVSDLLEDSAMPQVPLLQVTCGRAAMPKVLLLQVSCGLVLAMVITRTREHENTAPLIAMLLNSLGA